MNVFVDIWSIDLIYFHDFVKGEQRTSMFEANGGIGLKDGENVRNRCKSVVVCIGVKNCIVDTSMIISILHSIQMGRCDSIKGCNQGACDKSEELIVGGRDLPILTGIWNMILEREKGRRELIHSSIECEYRQPYQHNSWTCRYHQSGWNVPCSNSN